MTDAEIKALVGVYFQVSRAYGIVARLPEGVTGRQALMAADPRKDGHWERPKVFSEADCGDQFLRVHARGCGLWLTLSPSEFQRYLKAGGGTYR